MKKLMIAAAIVCAAAYANAASADWQVTSGSLAPDGVTPIDDNQATFYGWVLNPDQYKVFSDAGAAGVSAAVWAQYGALLGTADYSCDYEMEAANFVVDGYSKTETAYIATIFAFKDDEGNVTHYVGNAGAYEFTADADGTIGDMNTIAFGYEEGSRETPNLSWSSVPEPTSGLLLLLGVAGLALRRRRA